MARGELDYPNPADSGSADCDALRLCETPGVSSGPRVIIVEPTHDPEEFAEALLPVTPLLQISAVAARFRGAAKLIPSARMGLFLPKISTAHVVKPVEEDLFTLNLPLRQPMECRIGGRFQTVEPGNAYLAGPGSLVDFHTATDSGTLVLNIDAELVRSHWMGPEDRAPIRKPCVIPLTNERGRTLFQALSDAWRETFGGQEGAAHNAELEDRITLALAHCLAPDVPVQSARRSSARALHRARAYIRAHLGDRLSVPDIVAAAGVSNRTLYRLFLEAEGLTPMQYVTTERLNAIRRLLLTADPDEISVTRAAIDHGFGHLGRFSVQYRNAFGEPPSSTLRR